VLVLGLAVILAVISVAAFPCWSYSERWGYRPSIVAGILLVFVALTATAGRQPRAVPTQTNIAAAAPSASDNARDASRKIILLPRDIETTQRDPGL
jgi:hypothetical protein